MENNNLYIIIPAYNEEETIKDVIKEWYPVIEKVGGRLVIIDDGSKDGTYEIMEKEREERPKFIPIRKENSGHGATVLYGYNYAIKCGADYIFQTDSDRQTVPEEFWPFWELRQDFDMVIGSRSSRRDGFSRIIVTKTLKATIKLCFGVSVADANTPFRLMKVKTLKKHIKLIPKNFNLSNVMLSVIYAKKNLAVKYIPITFRERQGGVNSINLRKIIRVGAKAVKDFRDLNKVIENADN